MSERSLEDFKKVHSTVKLDIQGNVYLEGDYARLEQVMDNLISNAIKYAPGSNVKISLSAGDDKATLIVSDDGLGVAKEKLEKIFNRYERATESRDISGLGLGLFLIKEIVKAHQGSIILESEVGKGAAFKIELPFNRS
jgi:signal transduction histidine kinase